MKIFLILTLSLCAVQCSDILVKVIQEAYIGNCKFGCNRCPTTGGNKTLSYYEAKLETAKQEQKALEQEVEKASSAETSIYNAGNATQDLVDAASGNDTRRHRRKRASGVVSLASCEDPSTTINGTVSEVIILVLQGIKSSLQALSVDNLDTTTLNCYITLALDLRTRLSSGLLVKPTDITVITTVAVSVQTSVDTVIVVVIVYREEKEIALATKKEEVEEAKADVITAGGTVVDDAFRPGRFSRYVSGQNRSNCISDWLKAEGYKISIQHIACVVHLRNICYNWLIYKKCKKLYPS